MSAAWPALKERGYRLVLVAINDLTGEVIPVHEYTEFLVPRVKEVLNDMDEMSFTLRVQDLGIGFLKVTPKPYYRTEVQLWRRDVCIFWGVVVGITATTATATFECRSLELYLRQRRPGPGAQTELVQNPSFEDSVPLAVPVNWTDLSGAGGGFVVTESATTGRIALGTQALLVAAGAGADVYFAQDIIVTAPTTAAQQVEIAAWWKSYFGFTVEDTFGDRGLFVARLTWPGGVLIDTLNCPVDATARDDVWRRCSIETSVPAATSYFLQIRLYIPRGTVLWDAVSCRRRFGTYTVFGEDRRALARRLVEEACMGGVVADSQGGGPNGDLASEIVHPPVWIRWSPDNPDVGDTRAVYIDHDTSSDFLTLLQDFPRLGYADFSIDISSGVYRYFRLHVPRRGTYYPEHSLEVGRNIVRLNYNLSSSNVADQLLPNGVDWSNTLPDPQPTDRDIWAQVSPTPESTIAQIEAFIPLERARRENPSPISSVTVQATSEAGSVLAVGDTVPIHASLGYLPGADGTYRILTRTLEPASELVTYEVALEP